MDKYKSMIDDLFDKKPTPTKEDLTTWLIDNEWRIAQSYERDCHREDILNEIDYLNEDREENKKIKVDDQTLNDMLEDYEDHLGDSEDWHYILKNTFDRFYDDLEMGVLDDDEEGV